MQTQLVRLGLTSSDFYLAYLQFLFFIKKDAKTTIPIKLYRAKPCCVFYLKNIQALIIVLK